MIVSITRTVNALKIVYAYFLGNVLTINLNMINIRIQMIKYYAGIRIANITTKVYVDVRKY